MVLLSHHDEAMGEGGGFELDDEVGDVLFGLGVVVVIGADVVYGGCCVFLVVSVEWHPKYAIVNAIIILQGCLGLLGPLFGPVSPRTAPLDRSPWIS